MAARKTDRRWRKHKPAPAPKVNTAGWVRWRNRWPVQLDRIADESAHAKQMAALFLT